MKVKKYANTHQNPLVEEKHSKHIKSKVINLNKVEDTFFSPK